MNEELQSTNEELQSINEELETSQEELRSVKEELSVSNSELQVKIDEVSQANNDLNNLFSNTNIAVVFLDKNIRIRRFTPEAGELMNFIESDLGRPLKNISTNLKNIDMDKDVREVLRTLAFKEKEVQDDNGNWYLMRIMPYRTLEDMIEGVVITLLEINVRKKAEEVLARDKQTLEKLVKERTFELNEAKRYAENIVETLKDPLLVLDDDLKIVSANNFNNQDRVYSVTTDLKGIDDLIIHADPTQICEVFNNILLNAFQAVAREKGKIQIRAWHTDKIVPIEFKDNGVGIDKKDLESVFNPFFAKKIKRNRSGPEHMQRIYKTP